VLTTTRVSAPRKRPLWQRAVDRLRYGLGSAGKARKRAAEVAARATRFDGEALEDRGGLRRRNYGSFEEYVDHQASKLVRVERRLRRVQDEDLEGFRANFAGCDALRGRHTVLCLGARIGTEVRALMELGHLAVGVDLNPGEANPYVLHGDFHRLVFPDRSFAAVYTNTLDHVFDLPRLIGEVRRVLAPGGAFIADVVPGYDEGHVPGEFESTFWSSLDDLVRALSESGLRLLSRRDLDRPPWQQFVMTADLAVAPSRDQDGPPTKQG
jgi:SAM-dependent methyltransferase